MSKISVEIIVPAYNEEGNLPKLIDKLKSVRSIEPFDVLIVNNGSTDNSTRLLQSYSEQFEWLRTLNLEKNNGYGAGINSGLSFATAEIIGWTHADLQFDPNTLATAVKIARENKGCIVKGRRVNTSFRSKITTFGMSILASIILNIPRVDINAQPKLLRRDFYLRNIKAHAPNDFSFDLFLLWSAFKSKLEIIEVDVEFNVRYAGEAKGGGASFRKVAKISFDAIKYMWRLRCDNF